MKLTDSKFENKLVHFIKRSFIATLVVATGFGLLTRLLVHEDLVKPSKVFGGVTVGLWCLMLMIGATWVGVTVVKGMRLPAGDLFETGRQHYVDRNYRQARECFILAADQGHADAQCLLGVIYDNGQGVARDYKKAFKWFQRAANQNNAGGQFGLGVLYRDGNGVKHDYKEAYTWIARAADQGLAEAQFNLGTMCLNGHGTERNLLLAEQNWRRAANQGHVGAKSALTNLIGRGAY
jgi:hypothetical protein